MSDSNDTFTDTDGTVSTAHALDSGGYWLKHPNFTGANEIQSNQMTSQAGSNGVDYSPTAPATEYDVQEDHNSIDNCGGPCARIDTALSTMYLSQYVSGAAEWRLQKLVSGALTTLGTYSGDAPSVTRTVKMEIRDSAKKLFIDGVERISSSDNAITAAGRSGYFLGDTSDNMDNWSSTDVGGGAGGVMILRRRREGY